jgi:K+-transporting ATPase ATPase A chain
MNWLQIAIFAGLVVVSVEPCGNFVFASLNGEGRVAHFLAPAELWIYRLAGVDSDKEQSWTEYAFALLMFNFVGILVLYGLLRLQGMLPLNPQHLRAVPPDLALNVAVSFATNTSWQSYAGESTLSYLTQMAGITPQMFVSGATGIAVAMALVRGLARHSARTIGNFWVDITRATLYVLLPLALVASLFLVFLGVPQTIGPYVHAVTLEGSKQLIALGPVASQEAIKLLSGDGGGFFNANSAHPFENPTALSNLVEVFLMFLIGAGLTYTFGRMVKDQRQGWALFAVMAGLFLAGLFVVYQSESAGNPLLAPLGISQTQSPLQSGGNMEGKEVRFGIGQSALFATVSTASSDGAVNAMHDSFMPLSGLILMTNMMLDEVVVGGPGSGLFGMLLFVILAVFAAGLMIGRTPEYLGNKIEAAEIKMIMLALLCVPAVTLGFTAIAAVAPVGLYTLGNSGPHGYSEILYAFTSGTATNGSSFAGLGTNTTFYNLLLAAAMFCGRFLVIVPVLCIAGSLASKKVVPASEGTLPTHGALFAGFLAVTILIMGGLTYLPALSLGPVTEYFQLEAK